MSSKCADTSAPSHHNERDEADGRCGVLVAEARRRWEASLCKAPCTDARIAPHTSGHFLLIAETTPPPAGQSSGENHHFRKRQLPATFECSSEQAGKKGMQGKWSKSASELKAGSGDRLSFIVKGSSEKASAGRRSLEADRRVGKLFLSREQQRVYDLVVNDGKSIFFTGSAGTGKSVVLREIIRGMRKKHAAKQDAIAVTASTGIAACNISGVTLHSYAGVGLGNEPKEVLVGKVKKNRKAVSRWLRTHALFIDESAYRYGRARREAGQY